MYKAILFDMDGTVLNSLDGLTSSLNHILTQFSLPTKSTSQVRNYLGYGYIGLWKKAVPDASPSELNTLVESFKAYYELHCCTSSKAYTGMLETLKALREHGYKTAIVSNKGQKAVTALHAAFFDGLVDFSLGESEQFHKKPAPDMLWEALRRLHCSRQDAIYIGDSEVDSRTADAAGLDCTLVTWGFRDKAYLEPLPHKYLVDSPQALRQLFL